MALPGDLHLWCVRPHPSGAPKGVAVCKDRRGETRPGIPGGVGRRRPLGSSVGAGLRPAPCPRFSRWLYSKWQPKWRNWQTRATQNRVPSGLWGRVPPSAPLDYKGRPRALETNPVSLWKPGLLLPGAYGTIRTMSSRLLRFLIGVALGIGLGLGYAWRIQPV